MVRKKSATTIDMTRFAPLTDDDIKAQTDSGSFTRGLTYFRNGRIRETVLRDGTIEALCEGSEIIPYRVQATLAQIEERGDNPKTVSCTCPRGGFCKHIVALLLTWIDDPARFVERPPLADLLGERSRDDLITLVGQMVQRYPDLESLVELPTPHAGESEGSANVTSVDAAMIRRHARSALQGFSQYDYYEWGAGHAASPDLYNLPQLGQSYVAAGQWANAQVIFTNLAEEVGELLIAGADSEEGELAGIVIDCDAGLAACLDAQPGLPESERLNDELRERLIKAIYDIWHLDVFDIGGIDLSQHGVEAIARNLTDDERMMVEGWLREERADGWSKGAVTGFQVMLREVVAVDDEELLRIYREAEFWDDVAAVLLRQDRVDEAVAIAVRYLTEPYSLCSFANALIERGGDHVGRALSLVDDRAWEVDGVRPMDDFLFQQWLVAQFSAHDRPRDALRVAERRFKGKPALQTWHEVRDAAQLPGQPPETWTELRPQLDAQLRSLKAWTVLVDIYLEEDDVAKALAAFAQQSKQERQGVWFSTFPDFADQGLRLAQAAERDFPDEAVSIYRQKAQVQIDHRQRVTYKVAAEHLARVKAILVRDGRTDEWNTLITDLRTTHKTLRALREELDALDLN